MHRRDALNARGQAGGQARHGGDVAGAARKNQLAATPDALIRLDEVAAFSRDDAFHARSGLDRCLGNVGKRSQVPDDFRHRHIAVGLVAGIPETGQTTLPVRRQKAKRVPPLLAPGVRDLAPLEQHVVDRAVGEMLAHGEPGLAGADDDGRSVFHDTRSFSLPIAVS